MEERAEKSRANQAVLLEREIQGQERELERLYCHLGKSIYDAAERRIAEIDRLVECLVENKIRLTQVRGQVLCSHCLTPAPKGNRYCGKCGRELDPAG